MVRCKSSGPGQGWSAAQQPSLAAVPCPPLVQRPLLQRWCSALAAAPQPLHERPAGVRSGAPTSLMCRPAGSQGHPMSLQPSTLTVVCTLQRCWCAHSNVHIQWVLCLPQLVQQISPVGKGHQFGPISLQPQQQPAPPRASAAELLLLLPAVHCRLEPASGQHPNATLCAARPLESLPGYACCQRASAATLHAGCSSGSTGSRHRATAHLVAAAAACCSEVDTSSRRPAASSCSRWTSASRSDASNFRRVSSADRLHAVCAKL